MSQIIKSFNDKQIRIRPEDKYLSLTDMAKASGKLYADWNRLASTAEYLDELSSIMGIPIIQLIDSKVGNLLEHERGTWGHPKVALRFAQWCSAKFAVQVDYWIDELLSTGSVNIKEETDEIDLIIGLATNLKQVKLQAQQALALGEANSAEIAAINQRTLEATEALKELPAPTAEVPELSLRIQVNTLVRDYCYKTKLDHSFVWRSVYTSFRNHHHHDIMTRAKNLNISGLEYAERAGLLEQLYAVAHQLINTNT